MAIDAEHGIVGLGQIGGSLAKQAVEKDIDAVGVAPSEHDDLQERGIPAYDPDNEGYGEFVSKLSSPRVVYVSVPAGDPVDEPIETEIRLASGLGVSTILIRIVN